MRTILIWARICSTWNRPGHTARHLLRQDFWRGRASSSSTTTFFRVPRAILPVRVRFVKSFLHDWVKFFSKTLVFAETDPVPTLVLYAQTSAMSRIILGNPGIKFEKRGADYTVVRRRKSSTFCTIALNKSLDKSLRGSI
jgi:hypothetical protein